MSGKSRLDKVLFDRGLAGSRDRARALILAGNVYVNGRRADKAGEGVDEGAEIEVRGPDCPYVSRGGLKLAGALDHFGLDPSGLRCLDVGISTGGFSDCLLQRGAREIVGVDVGYGQLAWKLRSDQRVRVLERTNARALKPEDVGEPADLAVIDVSFISLSLVLPAAAACVARGGDILALVKPQFEVGKGKVGAGGVVRDEALRREAVAGVREFAIGLGLSDLGECESPITGPKGNHEYFLRLGKVRAVETA
jgi:23S rRNA (cytidine1920-2'-O)/16S rRNA (cytidine1409-2'-O)-methyltransferase